MYVCEDEKTSLLELRENECNKICWVGRAVDLIRYIHIFFLSLSFSVEREWSFFLLLLLSWLVTAFPCRPRSNYRNGPTSLLSPLFFFFSRVHRELCLFSSRSLLLFLLLLLLLFFIIVVVDFPMHQSILVEFFLLLRCLLFFSRCHPPRKKKLERTQTRWMNAPSESVNRKAEE